MNTQLTNNNEKIDQLKKELDKLIVDKFVDELTFEDLTFSHTTHDQTKIIYVRVQVQVPQIKVSKKGSSGIRTYIHLGRKDVVGEKLLNVYYQKVVLRMMKEHITEQFIY